jgi:hypothetical protein
MGVLNPDQVRVDQMDIVRLNDVFKERRCQDATWGIDGGHCHAG